MIVVSIKQQPENISYIGSERQGTGRAIELDRIWRSRISQPGDYSKRHGEEIGIQHK